MKNRFYALFLLVAFMHLVGCSCGGDGGSSPEKMFEKYRKSVVLIRHEYYYKLTVGDKIFGYFTNHNEGEPQEIYHSKEDAIQNRVKSSGTGFFIHKEGLILTNRHVARDWMKPYQENCANNLQLQLSKELIKLGEAKSEKANEYRMSQTPNEMNLLSMQINELDKSINQWTAIAPVIRNCTVELETYFLGIALDGAIANRLTDYMPCSVYKVAEEKDVDLATIQLNSRALPSGVNATNLISVKEILNAKTDRKSIRVNQPAFLIGYNYGTEIADSPDGLRVQFLEGKTMQDPDDHKIMYNMSGKSGSSGSPVLDKSGKLVAVNFARRNGAEYNYGILAKHLKLVVDENRFQTQKK